MAFSAQMSKAQMSRSARKAVNRAFVGGKPVGAPLLRPLVSHTLRPAARSCSSVSHRWAQVSDVLRYAGPILERAASVISREHGLTARAALVRLPSCCRATHACAPQRTMSMPCCWLSRLAGLRTRGVAARCACFRAGDVRLWPGLTRSAIAAGSAVAGSHRTPARMQCRVCLEFAADALARAPQLSHCRVDFASSLTTAIRACRTSSRSTATSASSSRSASS